MANSVTTYQCPTCTAPLMFDSTTGTLQCEFCSSSYHVYELEALMAEKERKAAEAIGEKGTEWDTSEISDDWGKEAKDMQSCTCPSCGAELICRETAMAMSCPYCGNPAMVPAKFSGALRPDYVIPFKLNKEKAKECLRKHYERKFLLPRRFKSEQVLEEMKGVYVPFWLVDGVAWGDGTYNATRTQYREDWDHEYTDTYHYLVKRSGTVTFKKVPVDASSRMDDAYMDSIAPYDYNGLKRFTSGYLVGYLADKYDVTMEECAKRADERARNTVKRILYEQAAEGYSTCITIHEHVELSRGKVAYGLLPVWLLTVKWGGKQYRFAVNGQTGKTVGDLPIDFGKLALTFAGIASAVSAVGLAIASVL